MLENPHFLRESTEMGIDPFSDILRLMDARALLTGGFTAGGPWAIRFPAREKVKFFAILKGSCWCRLEGEDEPAHLETGDVGLLSVPRSYVTASDLDVAPIEAAELFSAAEGRTTTTLGDGRDFAHIGGHVELDPSRSRMLADVLPPWIHIKAASPQAATFRWLLQNLAEENAGDMPGAQLASAQLTQLLFIQILRAQLATTHRMPPGWLRAAGDARIAPALRLMHSDPGRSWTLGELAKASAMSRSTFADHFRNVAGITPLAYLTEWRMRLAERAMREETTPVGVVAQSLGYTSESAFSNAFKRATGRSPRAYRKTGATADVDGPQAVTI